MDRAEEEAKKGKGKHAKRMAKWRQHLARASAPVETVRRVLSKKEMLSMTREDYEKHVTGK